MTDEAITTIETEKVKGLEQYAGQYVAISTKNEVVGSGATYTEVVASAGARKDFALFAIPKLEFGFAPISH